MNAVVPYSDGATVRRYTGFPLNSTLVSSYTPDTIRSIINHAAAGQPYNTAVWIGISRVGIQINAQDPQIAQTRRPVFIPVGLVHDIFIQPTINNVICIVYDEIQSNMKGILLYVVHPNDIQSIREDFRVAKQGDLPPSTPATNYSSPFDNRYSTAVEMYSNESNQQYSPIPVSSTSPRRIVQIRSIDRSISPRPINSSHRRRHRHGHSSNNEERRHRKHRSPTSEKSNKTKSSSSNRVQELSEAQILQQQQQLLYQQQMAAWQAAQQMPMVPTGIYNRYVPKTIQLPTGETLQTTLVPTDATNGTMNGKPHIQVEAVQEPPKQSVTRSRSNENDPKNADETKRYLKALVEEVQSLKTEMNKIRQTAVPISNGRSPSVQYDIRQLRSDLDVIRAQLLRR